ncbi:MAG: S-layer homology domain-containing protein [bacterium]|nr:S-layer homology domain-containing protein [bacterium]
MLTRKIITAVSAAVCTAAAICPHSYAQEKPDYSSMPNAPTDKGVLMNSDDINVKFSKKDEIYYSDYSFSRADNMNIIFIYGASAGTNSTSEINVEVYNAKDDTLVYSEKLTTEKEAKIWDFPDESLKENEKYYYKVSVDKGNEQGYIHIEYEYLPENPPESVYKDINSNDTALITAAAYLTEKGVMNGYEDGTFRSDKTVTRAELAKMLYLADKGSAAELNKTYIDVDKSHWAYEYISKSSFFSGYEDNSFRPDNEILMRECITVMVRAAGFDDAAKSMNDKYPHNYMKTAIVQGLTSGIDAFKDSAETTRRDAAVMMYNVLQSKE